MWPPWILRRTAMYSADGKARSLEAGGSLMGKKIFNHLADFHGFSNMGKLKTIPSHPNSVILNGKL
jgi:hypothetical protein